MELAVSREFKSVQVTVRQEKGEISPDNIDDGARVSGGGGSKCKRSVGEKRWIDSELHYQERETMIWADKLKSMGPGALGYCHKHTNLSHKLLKLAKRFVS